MTLADRSPNKRPPSSTMKLQNSISITSVGHFTYNFVPARIKSRYPFELAHRCLLEKSRMYKADE